MNWKPVRDHVLDTTPETHAGWSGCLSRGGVDLWVKRWNSKHIILLSDRWKGAAGVSNVYLRFASANSGASSEKDCSVRGIGQSKVGKGEMKKDTL